MATDRPENHAFNYFDQSKYHKKLSFGVFFGKYSDKAELSGIYRVLRNVMPCMGNMVGNLMYLNRICNPIGKGTHDDQKIEQMAEEMMELILNHPMTKDGLVNIVRKLMTDTNKLHSAMKTVVAEVINLMTRCYHLLSFSAILMAEQIKMKESKRLIGRHIMSQFCKQTPFGKIVEQLEFAVQQFHNVFYRSCEGMTVRGTPRLILDISDCSYIPSGAFEKWTRKCEDSEKYFQIRGRMQDLDVECQGKISE